jgi:hypothetical protein
LRGIAGGPSSLHDDISVPTSSTLSKVQAQ